MLINPVYITGLSEEQAKIKKLILFCIEEGINISELLTDESGMIITKKEFDEVIEKLIVEDYNKGLLITDYSGDGSRLKLSKPLFIQNQVEGNLNKVRDYFTSSYSGQVGKAGDPITSIAKLKQFMEDNGITLEEAEEAARVYIDSCLQNGRFIKDFPNFIEDQTGSTLRVFVEEIKQRKHTNYDLSRFI